MKAKRILSLLLTVAMIAACGVTAFAAPVEGYVRTASIDVVTADVLAQQINANAAMPDLDEIKIDVNATKATDDELKAIFGSRAIPSGWSGKGYLVEVTATDLGDLYIGWDSEYSEVSGGFGITQYKLSFVPVDKELSYKIATTAKGDVDSKIAIQTDNSTMLQSNTIASGKHVVFPIADGAEVSKPDASFTVKCALFAEDGAKFNINNVVFNYSNLKYNADFVVNRLTEDDKAFIALQAPAWHPATITLGEAEGGDDPVVVPAPGAVTGGTTGVAFKDGSDIYDNAFEVSATFSNADAITAAGVLFIPAAYYAGATLDKDTENVAIAEYVGNAAGKGTITIRAAIKGIPRGLVGEHDTVDMRVKSYLRVNDDYKYGEESTVTIDVTEIAPEA